MRIRFGLTVLRQTEILGLMKRFTKTFFCVCARKIGARKKPEGLKNSGFAALVLSA